MLIATDVVMFYIRLTLFFVTILLLLSLVGDVTVSITSNEQDRSVVQLAENYLESNLTVARGVFNASALIALDGSPVEMVRLCSIPSAVEFSANTGALSGLVAKFGYTAGGGISQDFPIWLKFDEQLVPGTMKLIIWPEDSITLYLPQRGYSLPPALTGVSSLGCAIERAWVYKLAQNAVAFECPWSTCVLYTEGDSFCVSEGIRSENALCRNMPGVTIEGGGDKLVGSGKHKLSAVPIKKYGDQLGVLACDGPDTATGTGDVGTVMICEVAE